MTDRFVQISGKKEMKVISNIQGLPSGLLNEGPRDSVWGQGVLDYDSGFCCFKEVKTTA